MVKQRDNWLGQKMESMAESELMSLFDEIVEFRGTGILCGGALRALEREFSDNVSKTPYGENMRLIEDEVLFEIARRTYNQYKCRQV